MNLIGCILDKPRRRPILKNYLKDITILIAAHNEESSISDTIKSISEQTSFLSFLFFTFVYSIILAPACIKGYISETFNKKYKWK